MYQDKTLVCKDCGKEFVFTAGEQEFYAEKGFQNARRPAGAKREMYTAICSACGKETEVPFKPSEDRPVYCRECYEARRK